MRNFLLRFVLCVSMSALWLTISVSADTTLQCGHYVPSTPAHILQAKRVFQKIMLNDAPSPDDLAAIGFTYHAEPGAHWLLDSEPACSGHGHYYFSTKNPYHVLLEAPHQYTDSHTGDILRRLLGNQIRAATWSSVKRSQDSDETHLFSSYLLAFTQVFLKNFPQDFVVQLHGFSAKKHQLPDEKPGIIVSEGIAKPDQQLYQLAQCLHHALNTQVSVYPIDIAVLGATKNTVGRWVNQYHPFHFIHIEMSGVVREKMLQHTVARKGFAACLSDLR